MADIQYLNYGDLQIELLAFLDKAKKEVYDYVRKLPWSTKRKERFMSAYSDIMTRGVLGASVDDKTGLYKIQVGGDVMNISPDDLKIYGDAAAYLLELMASLPTKASLEEEAKKKAEEEKAKLPIFDNEYFKTNFINHLSKNEFGGSKLFDTQNDWNGLDKRDEKTGLRGREERARILARNLQSYADSLDETKLNFEGSPFENLLDFKDRINKAVYALTETPDNIDDDNESLRRLGIRASDWFNNGSGDPSGLYINLGDGTKRELTYGELAQHNLEQENKKLAALKQAAYNNTLFINRVTNPKMLGRNPVELKEKYKDSNSLLTALLGYAQQDIRSLTPDEISEVHGAYRNLANAPIDSKLLSQLQNSSSGLYKNSAPNRFRKINGIDNLIWDSVALQVILINNRQLQQALLNRPLDLFANVKTKLELEDVPRGGGVNLTNADYRDIYATIADLGALVNPELFTGTAMALSASGARTWNSIELRGVWDTLTDWKTWADWGTGALGGTALLGDASSAVKVVRGFGKLMTIPAIWLSLNSVPEAKAAWNKIDLSSPIESAKKLTPKDYHALSTFLMGIVSGRNYLRGNLAERAVLKHSGINTESKSKIREYSNKFGLTRTKPQNLETVSTLKVKKIGEDGKVDEKAIPLDKKQKAAIQKAKPSEVEAVAKAEGVKIPLGYKVEVNKSKINTVKSYYERPLGRANSEVIGKLTLTASKKEDDFENWLGNRGIWNKWKLGTNKNLRKIRENIGVKPIQSENSETSKQTSEQMSLLSTLPSALIEAKVPRSKTEIRRDWKDTIERKLFTTNELLSGEYNITNPKDSKYNVNVKVSEKDSEGFRTLIINGSSPVKIKTQKLLLEKIAKAMLSYRNTVNNSKNKAGINHKEIGKILRDLKAKGWLKEGGRIDKQKIQKYKNFINK